MVQRRMTQRLLAASGLPPMSDEDETVHNSLNEVIQDWTAQVSPITSKQSPPFCDRIIDMGIGDSWWTGLGTGADSICHARRGDRGPGQEERCQPDLLLNDHVERTTFMGICQPDPLLNDHFRERESCFHGNVAREEAVLLGLRCVRCWKICLLERAACLLVKYVECC